MRNFSDKSCLENINLYFIFKNFFSENNVVHEITCKNILGPNEPQMRIWRMRISCWKTKDTR